MAKSMMGDIEKRARQAYEVGQKCRRPNVRQPASAHQAQLDLYWRRLSR